MTADFVQQHPDWDQLFQLAADQDGLFTTQQAAEVGYSSQLLAHYLRQGRVARVRRGIYQLVHFRPGKHQHLVVAWLWTNRAGVISHQTVLSLCELSDVLPVQTHLTLPLKWKGRRFRIPDGVVLHFADIPQNQQTWLEVVPITTFARTLNDCAMAGFSPDLLRQATRQALKRGVATRDELEKVQDALHEFGGID
jgi:predicted transcriptional regulator of viral defense system